jgi:hypothetical protein
MSKSISTTAIGRDPLPGAVFERGVSAQQSGL